MKNQSRREALGNFGNLAIRIGGGLLILFFVVNHLVGGDSPDTRGEITIQQSGVTATSTSNTTNVEAEETIEDIFIALNDVGAKEIELTTSAAKFLILDAYLENDHLLIEYEFTNTSNEVAEPMSAYRKLIDEVTQEDDNAIYDIDVDHFYDLMDSKSLDKISSANPQIKPDGVYTFYVPYLLENDSDVTFSFENSKLPKLIFTLE